MGGAVDGHRPHHANGRLHQDLQRPHPEQQPQTAPSEAAARYTASCWKPAVSDDAERVGPSTASRLTEGSGKQLIPVRLCLLSFLRHPEEEAAAAGEPAAAGPAALSPAQRELPDGTDEALRDVASPLSCAFKGSTSLQRVTFTT